MRNVVSEVVANGICIGCGVCSGVCPNANLTIGFNSYGEYNSTAGGNCLKNCELCLKICPFSEHAKNENTIATEKFSQQDGVKYNDVAGYYLQSYVGYSLVGNHRLNGASGGLVTYLLETMLNNGLINFVVSVSPTDNPDKLFNYQIFDNIEDVRNSSKSAYYPVELSDVINEILKTDGKFAVVGLPCYLKGLELAKEHNKLLKERIVMTIGLVCGQLKSTHYTKYLGYLSGVTSNLNYVCYRSKKETSSAIDYKFLCRDIDGNEGKLSFQRDIKDIWNGRWFTPISCNFCEDIFAEVADVTVMDAWLDEYVSDTKGTSILVVRNKEVDAIINDGINNNELNISLIDIDSVIRSQRNVVDIKRNQIKFRLKRLAKVNKHIWKRSTESSDISLLNKLEILIKDEMQNKSRENSFYINSGKTIDYAAFTKKMSGPTRRLKMVTFAMRICNKVRRMTRNT